jgi:hypothetical protein
MLRSSKLAHWVQCDLIPGTDTEDLRRPVTCPQSTRIAFSDRLLGASRSDRWRPVAPSPRNHNCYANW